MRNWRLAISIAMGAAFGILAAFALPAKSAEGDEVITMVSAHIVRVIDGDTIVVDAHPWLGMNMRVHVRLRGVDAPERSGWDCPEERQLAGQAHEVVARMVDGVDLLLLDVGPDKYAGRVVARVVAGGLDIGEELLRQGLAHPYDGGARLSWCGGEE